MTVCQVIIQVVQNAMSFLVDLTGGQVCIKLFADLSAIAIFVNNSNFFENAIKDGCDYYFLQNVVGKVFL